MDPKDQQQQQQQEHEQRDAEAPRASTLASVYNKYLIDMVLEFKPQASTLKRVMRANGHTAIDPSSLDHIRHAAASLPIRAMVDELEPSAALTDPRALAFEPLRGVPLSCFLPDAAAAPAAAAVPGATVDPEGAVVKKEEPEETQEKKANEQDQQQPPAALATYLFTLAALCSAWAEEERASGSSSGSSGSPLAKAVLCVLSHAQGGGSNGCSDWITAKAGIVDDDIVVLLEKVAEASATAAAAEEEEGDRPAAGNQPSFEGLMKSLENSKIASIASEISKEIDLSGTENPMDLLNLENLGDGNSVLGNIVSRVGSKIQAKLASGEISQQDLLGEAVGCLKAFEGGSSGSGAGGMIEQLAKAMGSAKGGKGGKPSPAAAAEALSGLMAQLGGAGGGGGGGGGPGGLDMAELMAQVSKMGLGGAGAGGGAGGMAALMAQLAGGAGGGGPAHGSPEAVAARRARMRAKLAKTGSGGV